MGLRIKTDNTTIAKAKSKCENRPVDSDNLLCLGQEGIGLCSEWMES